jgi:spore photoproduct lyase
VLEFKTKTDCIQGLLSSNIRDKIVVSWSLNSAWIAAREEHGATSIRKRLEAARTCQKEGFVVGFHFDPIIEHPAWDLGEPGLFQVYASPEISHTEAASGLACPGR